MVVGTMEVAVLMGVWHQPGTGVLSCPRSRMLLYFISPGNTASMEDGAPDCQTDAQQWWAVCLTCNNDLLASAVVPSRCLTFGSCSILLVLLFISWRLYRDIIPLECSLKSEPSHHKLYLSPAWLCLSTFGKALFYIDWWVHKRLFIKLAQVLSPLPEIKHAI